MIYSMAIVQLERLTNLRFNTMFIMKSNFKFASPVAGYKDVKLLKAEGVEGIKLLPNAKAILTRLVNSNYLMEGKY